MKKIILISVLNFISLCSWCQPSVTSLSENFDVDCVLSTDFPAGWLLYNPISTTIPAGEWTCTPTNGRPNLSGPTPGIQCTDTFSSAYHLDTSFLVTPLLDLHSYSGSIFIQFDTKTSNIHLAGDLSVEFTITGSNPDSGAHVDLTPTMMPLFSNGDSSGWVTHVVDLSSYKSSPFYIAYRFTSTASTGSIWFLDNVLITPYNITLNANNTKIDAKHLVIVGFPTRNEINFSFESEQDELNHLTIFDMMGRQVYQELLKTNAGTGNYKISDLNLLPGMYILKMGNEHGYEVTKVIIQ